MQLDDLAYVDAQFSKLDTNLGQLPLIVGISNWHIFGLFVREDRGRVDEVKVHATQHWSVKILWANSRGSTHRLNKRPVSDVA